MEKPAFNAVDVMDAYKVDCKIAIEDLKILYEKLCINPDTEDTYCNKCILSNIKWIVCISEWQMIDTKKNYSKPIIRDLCFAIWHDDILNERSEEIAFCG